MWMKLGQKQWFVDFYAHPQIQSEPRTEQLMLRWNTKLDCRCSYLVNNLPGLRIVAFNLLD